MYKLNRASIFAEVKRKVHNSSLSDAQLELWCNLTQDYIWSMGDFKSSQSNLSFDTVADTGTYYLDASIGRVLSMVNTTEDEPMSERSESDLEQADPDRDITGPPSVYSMFGKSEVHYQLAAAGKVKAVSSSASDTTQTVRVIGLVSGVETVDTITLNGTTAVESTATFDADSILGVRLSAVAAGNITLSDSTVSLNNIVTIPAGKFFKMYTRVNLYPVPDDEYTIKTRIMQGPRPMISDYDIPDLPPEYHRLVLMGTLAQAHDEMYEFDVAEKLYTKLDSDIEKFRRIDNSIRGKARKVKSRGLRNFSSGCHFGSLPRLMDI
jgi:hypothetical protein